MRKLNCCVAGLITLHSALLRFFLSVQLLSLHHRPSYKGCFKWQFCRSQSKRFACQSFRNTFHLIKNTTRLNLAYPVLNVTLTFTLTNLKRLLSNWLVRENPNPDFTLTLNVTSHGTTCSLNLARGHSTTTNRFKTVSTKGNSSSCSCTGVAAFLLRLSWRCRLLSCR